MKRNNYYDVTDWQVGNPYTDIGEVINSIIADIKNKIGRASCRERV